MLKFYEPIDKASIFRNDFPLVTRGFRGFDDLEEDSNELFSIAVIDMARNSNPKSLKEKNIMVVIKGDPNQVWSKCSTIMKNGNAERIDNIQKDEFQQALKKFDIFGNDVIAVAQMYLDSSNER